MRMEPGIFSAKIPGRAISHNPHSLPVLPAHPYSGKVNSLAHSSPPPAAYWPVRSEAMG